MEWARSRIIRPQESLVFYSSFNALRVLVYLVWSGGARTCGGVDGIHVDNWHLFEQNLGREKSFEETPKPLTVEIYFYTMYTYIEDKN